MDIDRFQLPVSEIDADVLPLVRYFNSRGLRTSMSCSGHNDTNMSMLWVEFDEMDVTEKDIMRFQSMHTRPYFAFCSNGSFGSMIYASNNDGKFWTKVSTLRYQASGVAAMRDDLARWLEEDGYDPECNYSWLLPNPNKQEVRSFMIREIMAYKRAIEEEPRQGFDDEAIIDFASRIVYAHCSYEDDKLWAPTLDDIQKVNVILSKHSTHYAIRKVSDRYFIE